MSINIDVKTAKTGFWNFPKTFYALLFIEFWERFAFYGLQSVAVIYFIQQFKISESNASDLFSSFSALVYALLVIGGFVGDKILGLRRSYLLGIVLFILGYGLISIAHTEGTLYFAMGIVLVGNIFFKTNANNYVSRCFENNDPRLDSAFTYFYMSVNVGSFIGLIIVPIISKMFNYTVGLSLCSLSMIFALVFYFIFRTRFKLLDNKVGRAEKGRKRMLVSLFILAIIIAFIVGLMLKNPQLSRIVLFVCSAIVLVIYLGVSFRLPKREAKGMIIALILLLQAVIFWILYMQTATSFTLFAYHNINLNFLGYQVPAGLTQAFNPFYIIILSPILANLYLRLYNKGCDVSIPFKFAFGIFVTSMCFILLGLAANFFANKNAQISVSWLFIAYGFYSFGELLVSAIGPSMVAKLLPKRFGGFAQGAWFLSSAIGMKLGGIISSNAASEYSSNNPMQSLAIYQHLFYTSGIIVLILSVFLFIISKPISKSMNEVLKYKY